MFCATFIYCSPGLIYYSSITIPNKVNRPSDPCFLCIQTKKLHSKHPYFNWRPRRDTNPRPFGPLYILSAGPHSIYRALSARFTLLPSKLVNPVYIILPIKTILILGTSTPYYSDYDKLSGYNGRTKVVNLCKRGAKISSLQSVLDEHCKSESSDTNVDKIIESGCTNDFSSPPPPPPPNY